MWFTLLTTILFSSIDRNYGYSACDEIDIAFMIDTDIIMNDDGYFKMLNLMEQTIHHSSERSAFSVWIYGDLPTGTDYNLLTLNETVDIWSNDDLIDYIHEKLDSVFVAIAANPSDTWNKPLSDVWISAKAQPKPERNHTRRIETNIDGLGKHDDDQQYFVFSYNDNNEFLSASRDFICELFEYESSNEKEFVHFFLWQSDNIAIDFALDYDEYIPPTITCSSGFVPNIEPDSFINFAEIIEPDAESTDVWSSSNVYLDMIFDIICPSRIDASTEYGDDTFMELANYNQFIDKNTISNCILTDEDGDPYTPDLTSDSHLVIKDYKKDDNTFQVNDILLITPNELKELVKSVPSCCNLLPLKIERIEDDNANNNDDSYIQRKVFVSVPSSGMDYIKKADVEGVLFFEDEIFDMPECTDSSAFTAEAAVDPGYTIDGLKEETQELAKVVVKAMNETTIRAMFPDEAKELDDENVKIQEVINVFQNVSATEDLVFVANCDNIDTEDCQDPAAPVTRRRLFWSSIWRAIKRVVKKVVRTIVRTICPICRGNINKKISLLGGPKKYSKSERDTLSNGVVSTELNYGYGFGVDVGLQFKFNWELNWGGYIDLEFAIYGHVEANALFNVKINARYERLFKLLDISRTFAPRIKGIAVVIRPFFILQAKIKTEPLEVYAGIECNYLRTLKIGYYMKTDKNFKNFRSGKIEENHEKKKGCTKKFEAGNQGKGLTSTASECNPLQLGFDLDIEPIVGVALWEIAAAWLKLNLNVPFRIQIPETDPAICASDKFNCNANPLQTSFKFNAMTLSLYFGAQLSWPSSVSGYINLFKALIAGKSRNKIAINFDNGHRIWGPQEILGVTGLGCMSLSNLIPDSLKQSFEGKCCSSATPITWAKQSNIGGSSLFEASEHTWYKCPNGHVLAGFYRNDCQKLHCIEEMKCVAPRDPVVSQTCETLNMWSSFDNGGTVECKPGYFVRGIKGHSNSGLWCGIQCMEELECCKYDENQLVADSASSTQDWSSCFDNKGWCQVDNNEYITGFIRSPGAKHELYLLEGAKVRKIISSASSTTPSRLLLL